LGKRLLLGLLKGLILGVLIGVGFQIGLGWTVTGGLLGFLIAMAVGASAGVLCGKPPWRTGGWIESVLKAVAGVAVGALLFWLFGYVSTSLGFSVFGAPESAVWNEQPLLFAPAIAALFGTVIELDNTPEKTDTGGKSGKNEAIRMRAVALDEEEDFLVETGTSAKKRMKG
jgi:hypothetical protein